MEDHQTLLKKMLARMSEIRTSESTGSYKSLDNIMHGLVALDDAEGAANTAKQLYDVLQQQAQEQAGRLLDFREIAQHLSKDQRNVFNKAVKVLISDGRDWA